MFKYLLKIYLSTYKNVNELQDFIQELNDFQFISLNTFEKNVST